MEKKNWKRWKFFFYKLKKLKEKRKKLFCEIHAKKIRCKTKRAVPKWSHQKDMLPLSLYQLSYAAVVVLQPGRKLY